MRFRIYAYVCACILLTSFDEIMMLIRICIAFTLDMLRYSNECSIDCVSWFFPALEKIACRQSVCLKETSAVTQSFQTSIFDDEI